MQPIGRLHATLARLHRGRTRQRDEIYVALGRLGVCTKRDLALELAGVVDQATVYRTINFFLEIGVAQTVRYRLVELSDQYKQHHHHFLCTNCGHEITFNSAWLERALESITKRRNLKLESHQVELAGLCSQCYTSDRAQA